MASTLLHYPFGSVVRVSALVADSVGNPIDPTSISLTYAINNGTMTTVNYPGSIIKDSVGNYHYDVDTTKGPNGSNQGNGTDFWQLRWITTGTGQAQAGLSFAVDPTNVI